MPAWWKNWLLWTFIGGGFLLFGGLAGHGYRRMLAPSAPPGASSTVSALDVEGLFLLSLGGGIVVGLIGLALTLASQPRGIGWILGLGAVGLLLFLIFVWPTPYKYYWNKDNQLIRIHRLSGAGGYVVR